MGKFCEICEKGTLNGNNVSHSNRKTHRTWAPNVQSVRVVVRSPRPTRKRNRPQGWFRHFSSRVCINFLRLLCDRRGIFAWGKILLGAKGNDVCGFVGLSKLIFVLQRVSPLRRRPEGSENRRSLRSPP